MRKNSLDIHDNFQVPLSFQFTYKCGHIRMLIPLSCRGMPSRFTRFFCEITPDSLFLEFIYISFYTNAWCHLDNYSFLFLISLQKKTNIFFQLYQWWRPLVLSFKCKGNVGGAYIRGENVGEFAGDRLLACSQRILLFYHTKSKMLATRRGDRLLVHVYKRSL